MLAPPFDVCGLTELGLHAPRQAFESLSILEGTSSMAQRALQNNHKLRTEDSRNLSTYFNKVRRIPRCPPRSPVFSGSDGAPAVPQVRETMGKFEERLWSLIRNFIVLGRDNPGVLVNAVRIIELQELVDKQLEASGHGVRPGRLCSAGGRSSHSACPSGLLPAPAQAR